MTRRSWAALFGVAGLAAAVVAQQPPRGPAGPGGGPGGAAGPGGPGGGMMFGGGPPGMQQRKILKQFDKDGNGWLNTEERAEAREFLKKNPQGGGRGFGQGGGMRFGPGGMAAKPLLEALDTDKDGKLSKDEFLVGVRKFYTAADKDKKGGLDQEQLGEALNVIFPRPQGFGGPGGFGPPGGGPQGGPPGGGAPQGGAPQPPGGGAPQGGAAQPPGGGRGGFAGGPGGPGGPGGGMMVFRGPGLMFARGIVERADKDKDGKVTLAELTTAAEALYKEVDKTKTGKLDEEAVSAASGLLMPQGGFGGPPGRGRMEPGKPGPHVEPADVKNYTDAGLYEPTALRTYFLEFENKKDWEAEVQDFHATDVEVPCTLTVDGKKYTNVGVHFRGMSSYMGVPAGSKRSLNLSLDLADKKQRLLGHKTINLLNSHDDPAMMSTVLYSHIARQYMPAPLANFAKVVINGESWGVYVNVEQFDKEFIKENYKTEKGARWKVRGNPGADGGLRYAGEDVEEYKRRFTMKSADNSKDWKALVELCRRLEQTPVDKLEEALRPILDIDEVLWFLALDVALINNDGYWTRASDYSLYRDRKGRFHLIPSDMNEAFHSAEMMMFPGGFGGPGGGRRGPGGGPGAGPGGPGGGPGAGPAGGPPGAGGPGGPGGGAQGGGGRGGPGGGPPGAGGPGGGFGGPPGGPAMIAGGPGRGPGVELDPLVGLDNQRMPLRSKLLQVPSLRKKYLEHIRTIAEESLDWKKLGPVVEGYRKLIEKEVQADTRKLDAFTAFERLTGEDAGPARGRELPLRTFAEQRRKYLLNHPNVKDPTAPVKTARQEEGRRP